MLVIQDLTEEILCAINLNNYFIINYFFKEKFLINFLCCIFCAIELGINNKKFRKIAKYTASH